MESKIVDTYLDVLSPKMIEDVQHWIEQMNYGEMIFEFKKVDKNIEKR